MKSKALELCLGVWISLSVKYLLSSSYWNCFFPWWNLRINLLSFVWCMEQLYYWLTHEKVLGKCRLFDSLFNSIILLVDNYYVYWFFSSLSIILNLFVHDPLVYIRCFIILDCRNLCIIRSLISIYKILCARSFLFLVFMFDNLYWHNQIVC